MTRIPGKNIKEQDSWLRIIGRSWKHAVKSFFLLLIVLLGLSFMIATGGSSGGSGSGSSGTVSGSGK